MTKNLKLIIISVIAVAVFAFVAFRFVSWQQNSRYQGKLVFAASYDAAAKINRVVITNVAETIELKQHNNYWQLPAYDNYYADFKLIKSFFDTMNSGTYLLPLSNTKSKLAMMGLQNPQTTKSDAGILVQTFADDVLVDAVIIGIKDSEKGYFVARRADSNYVWLIDGDYDIPFMVKQWLPTPLLNIPANAVEMLSIDGKLLSRSMSTENFHDKYGVTINISWLLQSLSALNVTDVIAAANFDKKYPDSALVKIYDITTFYGLRFELNFYETSDQQIWLAVKLLPDTIALKSVNNYIEDNSFLYDGWYFKLAPEQKSFLMDYKLL